MSATFADQRILSAFRSEAMSAVSSHTVILVLATGGLPDCCWPMPRNPEPETGFEIDLDFPRRLTEAWASNPAAHDGAILAVRDSRDATYKVSGWSLRLAPPASRCRPIFNRGSAYNSALAMSEVAGVDAVLLRSADGLTMFSDGVADSLAD